MKIFVCTILFLLLSACNVQRENTFIRNSTEKVTIHPGQVLHIKTDFHKDVVFQGQYNFDDIDLKTDPVLYPGDSAAVFFAAIIAHAYTADAIKSGAMSQVQENANRVLMPYQRYLQKFENDELVSCVINNVNNQYDFQISKFQNKKVSPGKSSPGKSPLGKSPSGWLLKSEPVFYMTQDQRELILKHVMYVYRMSAPEVVVHKNIIEVSSARTDESRPLDFWVYKNKLPAISSELYAKSIKLFIDDMISPDGAHSNNPQKTFRYTQGGVKMFERGTLIENECGQTTMRTLRGWIKSFPSKNLESTVLAGECAKQSYVDHQVLVDISK